MFDLFIFAGQNLNNNKNSSRLRQVLVKIELTADEGAQNVMLKKWSVTVLWSPVTKVTSLGLDLLGLQRQKWGFYHLDAT